MRVQISVRPDQTICRSASSQHSSVRSRIPANLRERVGGKGCTDGPCGHLGCRLRRRQDLCSTWTTSPRGSLEILREQVAVLRWCLFLCELAVCSTSLDWCFRDLYRRCTCFLKARDWQTSHTRRHTGNLCTLWDHPSIQMSLV